MTSPCGCGVFKKSEATAVGENEWVYLVYMSLHGRAKEDAKNGSKKVNNTDKDPCTHIQAKTARPLEKRVKSNSKSSSGDLAIHPLMKIATETPASG